jgi:hypothetical protein
MKKTCKGNIFLVITKKSTTFALPFIHLSKQNIMSNYRERLQNLIYEATGIRDAYDVPFQKFNDKTKINFGRIRGSVRIANGRIKTECEADEYVDKVLHSKLL